MLSTITQHKFVVLIVAIVVAGGLWYGMSQSSTPSSGIVATNPDGTPVATDSTGALTAAAPTDPDTQNILSILLALRSVKLDDTIFSNPAFMSLKDFSTQILAEPAGRPDPFAPLGVGGQLPANTSQAPQTSTGR